jgi:hypothetical protein
MAPHVAEEEQGPCMHPHYRRRRPWVFDGYVWSFCGVVLEPGRGKREWPNRPRSSFRTISVSDDTRGDKKPEIISGNRRFVVDISLPMEID